MSGYSIFLRPFETEDYILINKWRNNLTNQKFTVGPIRYVSLEREKTWVQEKMMNNNKDIYWAICLNDGSRRMIGYTSLNDIDHINKKCGVGGIVIGENDCRDGVSMFEVALIKMDFAFNQLNINRLVAYSLYDHPITPGTVYALGFKEEGIMRDYVYKNGRYQDVIIYSLLKREYEELLKNNELQISKVIKRFSLYNKNAKV